MTKSNTISWQKLVLLAGSLALVLAASAQGNLNELTVDRPGIADTPFTVPKGTYQFEVGFDYLNRPTGEIYNLPTALFRTGISKRSELRISSREVLDKTDGTAFNGVSPVSAGFKMHIIEQNKGLPETDILANVVVPVNPRTSQQKSVGYEILLLFQNDFYPNTAINYNIGYVWDSNKGQSVFTASFCFNYLPTAKVGLFAEYFGYVHSGWPGEHGIDGGATYLVGPKLQLDLSAGVSRFEKDNNFFVSTGFTVRIN